MEGEERTKLEPAAQQPEGEEPISREADAVAESGQTSPSSLVPDPGVTAQFAAVSRRMALDAPRSKASSRKRASKAPRPAAASSQTAFRPISSGGGRLGIGATALLALCAVAALVYATGHSIGIESFLGWVAGLAALALAAGVGALTYGWRSMEYRLDDQKLTISWLCITETVPLGRVEGVFGGHRFGKMAEVDGVAWPGHYVGQAMAEELGRVKYYGTSRKPSTSIIIATAKGSYAITPADLDGFRARLISRLEALPPDEIARAREPRTSMPWLLTFSILRDGVALGLMGVALLLLLASFGYVSAKFPGLPELMPLHFNFANEPDLIGPPRDAFRMPAIGAFILLVNLVVAAAVHGSQREAGRILAAATPFIQLVMLIAILRVVH